MEYPFDLDRNKNSVKLHFLSGITLPPLLSMLRTHRRSIDWSHYPHRIAFLLFMGLFNGLVAIVESLIFSRRVREQQLHPAPLIILGHPRTGTTHLHNLLSHDGRYAYVTTWQAGFPSTFLCMRPLRALLSPLLSRTRPMDNMALDWDLPAEDEIATCALSGGVSPYLSLLLPREEARCLRRLNSFDSATPAELAAWESAFVLFCKKATFAAGPAAAAAGAAAGRATGRSRTTTASSPKPLLLKSPVHTARIRILLRIFPGAKFVYAHRHPLEVFASSAHMAQTYYCYCYLQRPTRASLTEFILAQFELLIGEYERQRKEVLERQDPGDLQGDLQGNLQGDLQGDLGDLVALGDARGPGLAPGKSSSPVGGGLPGQPPSRSSRRSQRISEVPFAELDRDPMCALARVYEELRLGVFEGSAAAAAVAAYTSQLHNFKKNNLPRLEKGVEAEVRRRWAAAFGGRHGYT